MDKILTISEIETQFSSEWILVDEPKTNEALEVQSGKVLFHSKDRDEVYRIAAAKHPARFAVLYTGMIPKDEAIVL
ncbi:hypothetical protein PN36_16815 [Candidatus Thiomargarita nelsonii]|uniref:DUF5678 domain-containing protein n=1 Tax=Candidatus Thiomargarita nelsonii TaxID=1003181 RepID=A0A0A6PMB6_9GAMM|nr:hypothetical protein PN36_16815 [Candidatus Thiomargarita nelsonii]